LLPVISRRLPGFRRDDNQVVAGGVDLSMMPESGDLGSADEACREYERGKESPTENISIKSAPE